MRTESSQPPAEWVIAGIAGRQYGVVSLAQLLALGVAASTVRNWVARGRLHRVHRGVYAVGHPLLAPKGRLVAAVLACGAGAVLSHRSAATLHGLLVSSRPVIEVSAPGRRAPVGVEGHRSVPEADRTVIDNIPCTAAARTLLDLADLVSRSRFTQRQLDRAVERAEALQIFDLTAIEELLSRSNGRRGAKQLRQAIRAHRPQGTKEELEKRLLELIIEAGLPRPLVNVPLAPDLVPDFTWPDYKLIVEADGWETHGTRAARQRDLARDRRLTEEGWRVIRFTWADVADGPDEVVRTLQSLLRSSGSSARRRPRAA